MLDDAKLTEIIGPVVEASGLTLYDAEFRGSSLLVMVDGAEGANLDQVASVSRAIARHLDEACLLYTSPSPRDRTRSRMPSSA